LTSTTPTNEKRARERESEREREKKKKEKTTSKITVRRTSTTTMVANEIRKIHPRLHTVGSWLIRNSSSSSSSSDSRTSIYITRRRRPASGPIHAAARIAASNVWRNFSLFGLISLKNHNPRVLSRRSRVYRKYFNYTVHSEYIYWTVQQYNSSRGTALSFALLAAFIPQASHYSIYDIFVYMK
jgi:hypothetical protein